MYSTLPRDILLQITLQLDIVSIANQSKASKAFAQLGQDQILWNQLCKALSWRNICMSKIEKLKRTEHTNEFWKTLFQAMQGTKRTSQSLPVKTLKKHFNQEYKIQYEKSLEQDMTKFKTDILNLLRKVELSIGKTVKAGGVREIAHYLTDNIRIFNMSCMKVFRKTVRTKFRELVRDEPTCHFLKEYNTCLFGETLE